MSKVDDYMLEYTKKHNNLKELYKIKALINRGFGNINSSIMLILNNKEDVLLDKIRISLESLNINIGEFYTTYYYKTTSPINYLEILKDEIKILKPKLIYSTANFKTDNTIMITEKDTDEIMKKLFLKSIKYL